MMATEATLAVRVGGRLREARLQSGLTVREVADRLGLKHAIIVKYENGTIAPSHDCPLDRSPAEFSTALRADSGCASGEARRGYSALCHARPRRRERNRTSRAGASGRVECITYLTERAG
jgi:DNA-binding XRE family transcriptional regulator